MDDRDEVVRIIQKEYLEFYEKDVGFAKQYILEINEFTNQHRELMLKKFGNGVMQFEAGFSLLAVVLERINYIEKTSWPPHRNLQYIFLIHNMKSLFASFDLLCKGFGESSLILLRTVYEAIINVIYISCYKENPYKVLNGEFKLTSFIDQELKLTHWRDYPILSVFAHANKLEIFKELKMLGEHKPIYIDFAYQQKNTELAINYIQYAFYFIAKFTNDYLFTSTSKHLPREYKTNLEKFIKLENSARATHPTLYWQLMTQDFDYIFNVMEVSEKGGDWKKIIRNLFKEKRMDFLRVLIQINKNKQENLAYSISS